MLEREVSVGDRYIFLAKGRNIVVTGIFGEKGILEELDAARYFRLHRQKGRAGNLTIMDSERMRVDEVNWGSFKGRFSLDQIIEGLRNHWWFRMGGKDLEINEEQLRDVLTYRYNLPPLKVRYRG